MTVIVLVNVDDKDALADFKPEGLDSAGVEDMVREFFSKCDPVSCDCQLDLKNYFNFRVYIL